MLANFSNVEAITEELSRYFVKEFLTVKRSGFSESGYLSGGVYSLGGVIAKREVTVFKLQFHYNLCQMESH